MGGTVKKDEARGTWYFIVDLAPGPDGQRRQKKQRGFPTKKAAQTAMAEVTTRLSHGTWAEPGRRRLAEYLEEWVEGLAASRATMRSRTPLRMAFRRRTTPSPGRHRARLHP